MSILAFAKKWTLPCGIVMGCLFYLMFSRIPLLIPVGDVVGPFLLSCMPWLIFLMLYITFCRIRIDDLKPRLWHVWLQLIRTLLSFLLVIAIGITTDPTIRLILEGLFVCVICPTAAAAPVITEKLGGNIASMTIYTLVANVFTSIIIPLFFPMVEKEANITFFMAFMMVLKRVVTVLVIPLCLALLTRRFLPKVASWLKSHTNLPFYLWAFNLSIVMGLALQTMFHTHLTTLQLICLLFLPFPICIGLFAIGKFVAGFYGESIGGGQALGQKNTIVGIWLTLSFLNPLTVIAPCAYVVWQNLFNAWQMWCKDKYGYLKW